MNLTPTRIALLRLLQQTGEYCVASLANKLAPRREGHLAFRWSRQAAARWGGAYVRPLEKAGLVNVKRFVDSGVGMVSLTALGQQAIRNHDAAQAQTALDAAVKSAA